MIRYLSKKLPGNIWNEDKGLTVIFVLLCVSNFLVIPFFDKQKALIYISLRIIWFVLLFAGITTLSESRTMMRKFSIIPVLLIAVTVLQYFFHNLLFTYLDFVVELAVFGLLIGMVLVKVFEGGSVTVHRIIGSIVVYMLIGNVWSQIYEFLYINSPGSIQFPAVDIGSNIVASKFLYFSYTTLTTTGFGDILPTNAASRTVVIIEQLIGVLYPVVLIGRLVSLVTGDQNTNTQNSKNDK